MQTKKNYTKYTNFVYYMYAKENIGRTETKTLMVLISYLVKL